MKKHHTSPANGILFDGLTFSIKGGGGGLPANAMLWNDSSPMLWNDSSNMIWGG